MSTIRAYRLESHFVGVSDGLMERNAHAFITQKLAAGWLAMRLDILGLGVLTLAGKCKSVVLRVKLLLASACGHARNASMTGPGSVYTMNFSVRSC